MARNNKVKDFLAITIVAALITTVVGVFGRALWVFAGPPGIAIGLAGLLCVVLIWWSIAWLTDGRYK